MKKINKNEIVSLELTLSNKEKVKIDISEIVDCQIKFLVDNKDGIKNLIEGKLILDEKVGEGSTYDESDCKNRKLVKERINGASDVVYLKIKLKDGKIEKIDVPYEEKEDKTTGGIYGYKKCSEVRYDNKTIAILMGNSTDLKNINF